LDYCRGFHQKVDSGENAQRMVLGESRAIIESGCGKIVADDFTTPKFAMSLDRAEVHKVANLARLALTEAEEEQFAGQLSGILDYVEQLNELDVSNVEPTTRAIDVINVTRIDEMKVYENREGLMNSAPDRDENFFKVPKIIAGD
jgi:aspartyl-tRNA(Asn)/glutamyl-tRNA(Gln) amidotransferase subunit C